MADADKTGTDAEEALADRARGPNDQAEMYPDWKVKAFELARELEASNRECERLRKDARDTERQIERLVRWSFFGWSLFIVVMAVVLIRYLGA